MRIALMIVGGLLVLSGCVWMLQGLNILPARMMAGQMQWVINGAIAAIVGAALFVWGYRRGR